MHEEVYDPANFHLVRHKLLHFHRSDSAGSKIRTVTPSSGALLIVKLPPAIASNALCVNSPPPVPVVELLLETIPTPSSATITSREGSSGFHDALRSRRRRRCTSEPRACRAALRSASCTAAKTSSAIAGGITSSMQAAASSDTHHSTSSNAF